MSGRKQHIRHGHDTWAICGRKGVETVREFAATTCKACLQRYMDWSEEEAQRYLDDAKPARERLAEIVAKEREVKP